MSTTAAQSAPAVLPLRREGPPQASAHRLAPAALWAACGAIVAGALLLSGVRVGELLLFAAFQAAYALVPGAICCVLLLGRPRLAVDALGLASALGLAIQVGCFMLTAALGERWLFSIYPAVLLVACAPLLYMRRAELAPWKRARPARPVPGRRILRAGLARRRMALGAVTRTTALASLAIALGAVFVLYLTLFATSPLPREVHSVSYYPDLVFNVSLAAELLHHWPFVNPSVSGVGLHYHVFVNAADAAAAQVTGIDLSTIVMRLQPTFLLGPIALELFALGRRLAGSAAGGLAAVALGLLAGEPNPSRIVLAGGGLPVLGFLFSPSYELGAVFFLAVCIVLVERLEPAPSGLPEHDRRRLWEARPSRGPMLALALLSFGAVGAKSSVVPILLAGVALFAVGRRRMHDASLAVLAAVGVAGYALLYRGGGEGLAFKPLDFLRYTAFAHAYARGGHSLAYALLCVIASAIVLCALFVPLIGALFLADRWRGRRGASTPERLLLGMLAASLPPFVLIAVPGDSQVYFVVYGFLAASVVSAAGLTRALGQRGRGRLLAQGAVALVALTIASEVFQLTDPTLERWAHGEHAFASSGVASHRGLTSGLLRGLEWLRRHSRPSDVIAVNNHSLGGNGGSRYVYYSAFAQRRVLIESWQYTPQGASYVAAGRTTTPFPRLLALNDAAVLRASPAAISLLRERYGVRYILIDRRHGPAPSPGLGRVARPVYSNPDVAVFAIGR
jgi:hypothetical protein